MKNIIKKILRENAFDWIEEHQYSQEEVIEFIKENGITEWKFMEHWEGSLDLRGTPIQNLGNLESVGGYLNLNGTPIKDLGNLESVGGNLDLDGTQIQNLGNLESVGGSLNLYGTPIENLGNLESVGGNLYLEGTPISKKYSEQEIRQMVQIGRDLYL